MAFSSASVALLLGQFLSTPFDAPGPLIYLPNDPSYWKTSGYQNIIAPLRLPTDTSETDMIRVWLKVPDEGRISALRIASDRYTLVYPPGTIADRVELDASMPGVDDVRGATLDADGRSIFHVFEKTPGSDGKWLSGYEWRRDDDHADRFAGEALANLYFPQGPESARRDFLRHNQCSNCHQANAPTPATTAPPYRFQSDTQGFFQPLSTLQSEVEVRNHRPRDLNAEDPFVTVRCGNPSMRSNTARSAATNAPVD
jgi:hypothetical protein